MKNTHPIPALLFALFCLSRVLCADSSSLFIPEAPEEEARALLNAYLPLLAAGEFEQAISLNDMRGMRESLLQRRLTELKTRNPELTADDLDSMSAQIQLNDLNPLRLKEILLGVLREGGYEQMTWRIEGYAPASKTTGGYLVKVDALTANGQKKPILLGIQKLGAQWMVAPAIVEELAAQKAAAPALPQQPPPDEVKAVVNTFWTYWQQGELNKAHALHGRTYRERNPLLPYLQQTQEVIARIGIPSTWTILHSRAIAPDVLGLGVEVQGSKANMQTIMVFHKTGETWVLEDSQYRPGLSEEAAASPSTPLPDTSPRFRSNLRPDLKSPQAPAPIPDRTPGGPAQSQ